MKSPWTETGHGITSGFLTINYEVNQNTEEQRTLARKFISRYISDVSVENEILEMLDL